MTSDRPTRASAITRPVTITPVPLTIADRLTGWMTFESYLGWVAYHSNVAPELRAARVDGFIAMCAKVLPI